MIDKSSGKIMFDNGCSIYPMMDTISFEKEFHKAQILTKDNIGGYFNYYLVPQKIEEQFFTLRIYFDNKNVIESVLMSANESGDVKTWENWNEEKELKNKKNNDVWLMSNMGKPPYNYTWGNIISDYDMRSGSSLIVIRYQ